jgi:hypothetical protein
VTNKEYKELFEDEKKRDNTPDNKNRQKEEMPKVAANNFFNE